MTITESLDSLQPKARAARGEKKTLWIGTSFSGDGKGKAEQREIMRSAIAKAGITSVSDWVLKLVLTDLKARLSKATESTPAPVAETVAETPAETPASKPKSGKKSSK